MTIRDIDKYIESLWDWGFLDNCFDGTKIKLTDIDGFVERYNSFLVVETKLPLNAIPTGQRIAFNELLKTGKFTIIIIWGKRNNPEKAIFQTKNYTIDYNPIDLIGIEQLVGSWFDIVNSTNLARPLLVANIFGTLLEEVIDQTSSVMPLTKRNLIQKFQIDEEKAQKWALNLHKMVKE